MLNLEGVATKPHLLNLLSSKLIIIQSYYYLNLLSSKLIIIANC